ncbi:hypothetical protein OMR07_07255 [Methylobacterium organophilum]|jgi:hypothetical protein|nr:hypothetical protein [Methylobacterium organophilum]
MTAKERSLSIGVCQSCGAKVQPSNTYCVACAIDHADRDAVYFDRWLSIFVCVLAGAMIAGLIYIVSRYGGAVSWR